MSNQLTNLHSSLTPKRDMFDVMEKALKFSEIIAKSDIIPTHYKGKPANVFIAVQTAYRMNMDPMLVMQNTFVVGGKLGMNTTFAISLANVSGIFKGGIKYKVIGSGENLEVTAYAKVKETDDEISYTVSYKMAHAEGWTKNSKYRTMPEHMLRFRAATFLIRTHAPEVINGMHVTDELEDATAAKSPEPQQVSPTVNLSLTEKIAVKEKEYSQSVQSVEVEIEGEAKSLAETLMEVIDKHNVPFDVVDKWLEKANVESLPQMSDEQLWKCITYAKETYPIYTGSIDD